jgi:hypothetical protein
MISNIDLKGLTPVHNGSSANKWSTMKKIILMISVFITCAGVTLADDLGAALGEWIGSDMLFRGKLTKVAQGPTGLSFPPMLTFKLQFEVEEVYRGELKAGDIKTLHYSVRQEEPPEFPEGESCIVKAKAARGSLRMEKISVATLGLIAAVESASRIPNGWTFSAKGFESPWAKLKAPKWTVDAGTTPKCGVTGRPAWLCGSDIVISTVKVPPPKEIKWTNGDGDGEYTITVTNHAKEAREIPALLQNKEGIQWNESLIILSQGKAYAVPGAKGFVANAKPVTLKPGESVSTVVNALQLEGPEWPKGGYRIEFQFCLGENSSVESFYYMSRHHDGVRAAALKKLKE